jgi:LacI family transcriptional regulator
LEYVPNRLAVALKAGRKGSIAVFVHQIGSPGSDVTDRLLGGLAEGLEKSGARMLLRFFKSEEEFLASCDMQLRSEVDGLIIAGASHPELFPKFRELERQNVKVVTLFSQMYSKVHVTTSAVDYELQGYLPTKHLLDQGLRNIACLDTLDVRTRGFRRAYSEIDVPVRSIQMVRCKSFLYEDGVEAAQQILSMPKRFEAVVCQSDAQAVGVINTFAKHGIRVPEDVKITGVDNSPLARCCLVPLTSVTSEMRPSGIKAVELLLAKIDGKSVSSVVITPSLEVRESSAPNPSAIQAAKAPEAPRAKKKTKK